MLHVTVVDAVIPVVTVGVDDVVVIFVIGSSHSFSFISLPLPLCLSLLMSPLAAPARIPRYMFHTGAISYRQV